MMVDEPQEHVTTTEARAGSTPHVARHVLIFGTGAVIILFLLLFLTLG